MDKYSDTYRIDSARLPNWNYCWRGNYFVTINTQKHINYFGAICNGALQLTEIGIETEKHWRKIIELRPDMNISLQDSQIMPNHFHGIISFGRNKYNDYLNIESNADARGKFGPQRKNLASIIRGFKGSVTSFARTNNILFDWQPRYYDHLIRNDEELFKIKSYIQNNVKNWDRDRFNKSHK